MPEYQHTIGLFKESKIKLTESPKIKRGRGGGGEAKEKHTNKFKNNKI